MTRVLHTRAELRAALSEVPRTVGLVPTMGWLHDGHRSLMAQARAADATTVVTIFVNPRQFDEAADYTRYPRDIDADIALCAAEEVDIVWVPEVDEVYPPGFDTTVSVGAVAAPLEGAARPGHFDGVATVVATLFALVGAEHAYFGQKDAQQVMVIRRMALDLALPTEVIACPTVREPDGLALSSRNVHLTPEERAVAPVLHRALVAARTAYGEGERDGDVLRGLMEEVLATEPLAQVEYVSVADALTLAELRSIEGPALLSMAVALGTTRLIDNELVGA
ncbi:MAG: pantoate--beta-alanine ligase [Candidatus Limnocylindrales bacterium]